MRVASVLIALLVAASTAAASAPRFTAAKNAKVTAGDDISVVVTCVEPNEGRYCVGPLRLNLATGGGGMRRRQLGGGMGANLKAVGRVLEGLSKAIQFESTKVLGGAMDTLRGGTLDNLGGVDSALQGVEGSIREKDPTFTTLRPELHDVTENLRQLQDNPDGSKVFGALKEAGTETGALAERLQTAAKVLDGEQLRQAEKVVERLGKSVEKADLKLYLGNGKRMTLNLR
jgi:hypothetical protein